MSKPPGPYGPYAKNTWGSCAVPETVWGSDPMCFLHGVRRVVGFNSRDDSSTFFNWLLVSEPTFLRTLRTLRKKHIGVCPYVPAVNTTHLTNLFGVSYV